MGRGGSDLKLECAIWLADSEPVFDLRCARVLEAVERTGSVHQAAAELRMSNSWAWQLVVTAEKKLGFSLLVRATGGTNGGGSALTHEGQELLRRYLAARAEVENLLGDVFDRYFADGGRRSVVDDSRGQVLRA